MSKPRRWVIVDAATSPGIRYNGTWFTDHGSFDSVGANTTGPPYLSTMRGTNSNASFTFNFAGPAVSIMGSNLAQNGSTYAEWACLVDGTNITIDPVSTSGDENNRYLCSKYAMDDGPHSITARGISVDANQTFWFDRIQYLPSPGLLLTNVTTAVWSSDSAPKYDSSWSYKENTCRMTTQHGAIASLDFYGSSLSWYGVVLPGYTGNSTTGTWSIDDSSGQNFTINGYAVNEAGIFNQKLFDTPEYPIGNHRLQVMYNGDSTTTPLAMAYIFIHNSSIDNSTSSTGSSVGSATPTTSVQPTSSSGNTGAAIGGAVGGAAILVIAIILFIFYRRRRRSRKEWNDFTATPEFPFVLSPQTSWRPSMSATDGGDSSSPSQPVNRVGGKARAANVVEPRPDSQASRERGVPQSKTREAAATVAFARTESIPQDTASGASSAHFSRVADTGISSSVFYAPTSSGDSPPEYIP